MTNNAADQPTSTAAIQVQRRIGTSYGTKGAEDDPVMNMVFFIILHFSGANQPRAWERG